MTELKINYYGMIAECTACEEEFLTAAKLVSVQELDHLLKQKHPNLKKLSYKIAINHSFVTPDTLVQSDHEIALLPPFAGG